MTRMSRAPNGFGSKPKPIDPWVLGRVGSDLQWVGSGIDPNPKPIGLTHGFWVWARDFTITVATGLIAMFLMYI